MGEYETAQTTANPIDSHTILYGVFGDPIKHSKSPLMMNLAFKELGINGVYAAFQVAPSQLKNAVAGIRAMRFRGVNVTVPHKVEVMYHLDELDETARLAGAVNTIVNNEGKLTGYNTDGLGYVRSLQEETGSTFKGKRVLILGAGGAARGVAYALAKEQPYKVWIANRTKDKADELALAIRPFTICTGMGYDEINGIEHEVDIVINTTSVGMHPNIDELPIDVSWLHEGIIASDLIYNPLETAFLARARELGCRIHSGLGMFIYQGAYALEYWTGKPAPVAIMREVVLETLK